MSRSFQVLLWGATGFTGKLVAEYLCRTYPNLRWAIGGRNQQKLEQVRRQLTAIDPKMKDLPVVYADSFDLDSLLAMCKQADVICSTVGPYSRLGTPLVRACVQTNTDYCDLTGEAPWIRSIIDEFHDEAASRKVKIVHCCGFDSIPFDLGVWMIQQELKRQGIGPASEIRCYVTRLKGGISGGTIASMGEVLEQMRQPEKRRLSANPYSLNPTDKLSGPDQGDQLYSKWDGIANMWTAPFIMAGINTRIVRRTNALLDNSYGANFCYSEVMGYRSGFRGWFRAKMMTVGFLCMGALMFLRLSRKILLRLFLPSPGQGPSEEKMKNGRFKAMFCAIHGTDKSWWEVSFDGDPGYSQTAIMLAESALALGLDRSNLSGQYGVITPSVGLGDVLLSRLRARGMIFRTVAR